MQPAKQGRSGHRPDSKNADERVGTMTRPTATAVWVIAALAAGALYLATMAPGIAWGDSGNAQLRVLSGHWYDRQDLVRSHIPFYVVATALTRLGVDPARAANLVAAATGALTVSNMAWLIALLVRRRVAVVCGASLLLFSHALWHQATVAEVMTFSTMLLSLELVLVVQFVRQQRYGWLIAALLVNGLGLVTHNMSLLIWPAYVVMIALNWKAIPKPRGGALALAVLALGVGASPLIVLFVQAWQRTGDAGYVLGEMLTGRFGGHVFNTSLSFGSMARIVGYTCYSFPSPLIFLSLVGAGVFWRSCERSLRFFLMVAFLGYFGFAIRYTVRDQHTFMVHGYLFGIILVAMGVDWLSTRHPSPRLAIALIAMASTAPVVYLIVPEYLRTHYPDFAPLPHRHVRHRDPFDWFLKPWRHGNHGPKRFAREVFDGLPQEAVLVVDSTLMPPLLYLQAGQGLRRDVQIIGAGPFQPWFDAPFDMAPESRDAAIQGGRMFTVTDDRRYLSSQLRDAPYRFIPHGIVFQVSRAGLSLPQ